jgi:CheY-like chemotaxis protein/uncharacterized protein YcgL (UPF0745 family)
VTRMALSHFDFEGEKIKLASVNSALEAKEYMEQHEDVALVLLDVVMETQNEGFEVAQYIREELNNRFSRIVMRTGQPGTLNVEDVIQRYDIDGFSEKTDLTRERFVATVYSALRSYRDIKVIKECRDRFSQLVGAMGNIHKAEVLGEFYKLILKEFDSLMPQSDSIYFVRESEGDYEVLCSDQDTQKLSQERQLHLACVKDSAKNLITDEYMCAFHQASATETLYLYTQRSYQVSGMDKKMFEAFCDDMFVMYKFLRLLGEN